MRILDSLALEDLVFFDIETAPLTATLAELPEELQAVWALKEGHKAPEDQDAESWWHERSGLYAEFGRVVCISLGFFTRSKEGRQFRVKSMADPNEDLVLQDFAQMLEKHFPSLQRHRLCGHNIKGFDIPYLCRRMIINGIPLPAQLDVAGLKPWEIPHVDTQELWGFGDRRHMASLRLLAASLGIPSPKDDIDGSQVGRVFWEDNDLDRIATYCAKDVVTTGRVLLRLKEGPKGVLAEDAVQLV